DGPCVSGNCTSGGGGTCQGPAVGTPCTAGSIDSLCGTGIICQGPAGYQVCCEGSAGGCADSTVCCSGVCDTAKKICDDEYPVTSFAAGGVPACTSAGTYCQGDDECCTGMTCKNNSCSAGTGTCGAAYRVGHSCTADSDCCSNTTGGT